MKLNRLETHDRLIHFKKDQEANIFQGAEDCLKKNPDSLFFQSKCPYVYLFAHTYPILPAIFRELVVSLFIQVECL